MSDGPHRDARDAGDHGDRNGPHDRPRDGHDGGPRGPANTAFLDLEITQVLYTEAEQLTRDAARELLREAIKARIKERMGPLLERIGQLAADEAIDDFEANRKIEALIHARQEASRALRERIERAVRGDEPAK